MKIEKLPSGIRALTPEETKMVVGGINDSTSEWWQLDGSSQESDTQESDTPSETGDGGMAAAQTIGSGAALVAAFACPIAYATKTVPAVVVCVGALVTIVAANGYISGATAGGSGGRPLPPVKGKG